MTDTLQARLREIGERHTNFAKRGRCGDCSQEWPCDAAKLVDALEDVEHRAYISTGDTQPLCRHCWQYKGQPHFSGCWVGEALASIEERLR